MKCLFQATNYEPIDPAQARTWFIKKYDHGHGSSLATILFDQGYVFCFESEFGDMYGVWTNVGPTNFPEDKLREDIRQDPEKLAYLKAAGPFGEEIKSHLL